MREINASDARLVILLSSASALGALKDAVAAKMDELNLASGTAWEIAATDPVEPPNKDIGSLIYAVNSIPTTQPTPKVKPPGGYTASSLRSAADMYERNRQTLARMAATLAIHAVGANALAFDEDLEESSSSYSSNSSSS